MARLIVYTSIAQQELHNSLGPMVAYASAFVPATGFLLPPAPRRAPALLGTRATTPTCCRGAACPPGGPAPPPPPRRLLNRPGPRPVSPYAPTPPIFSVCAAGWPGPGTASCPHVLTVHPLGFAHLARGRGGRALARVLVFFPLAPRGTTSPRCLFGPAPEACASRCSLPNRLARIRRGLTLAGPSSLPNRPDSRRFVSSLCQHCARPAPARPCRAAATRAWPRSGWPVRSTLERT